MGEWKYSKEYFWVKHPLDEDIAETHKDVRASES